MPDTIKTAVPQQSPPANAIQHTAKVYLLSRRMPDIVHLVQYDQSLPYLAVELYEGDEPYTVPDGAAINIRMAKPVPSDKKVYNPAYGISEDRHTAYIGVTAQMTVAAGCCTAIIEVVVDGGIAGTGAFPIIIDPNPVPEDVIDDSDEYKTIQELVAQAQALATAAAGSASAAKSSATAAASSASAAKTSETNAKTSQTQAATSASAAASSASAANTSKTQAATSAANAANSASAAASSAADAQEYAEQAQQVSQGAVGYYETGAALKSAHPTGKAGNWAIVGDTDTIWIWDTDTSNWIDTSQNVNLTDYYTKAQADDRFATAVAYTVTVPASGWTSGSLTWGGMTLTKKCTVTASSASASPTGLAMEYAGGDYAAYFQIALLDTAAGSVTFWAQAAPAKDTQVRITEVRGCAA